MAVSVVPHWKLLFWLLIISFDANSNAINSSSFASLWLLNDNNRNLNFGNQSKNNTRSSPSNLTYNAFYGNFSINERTEPKNRKKLLFYFDKVNTSNQHYDYDEIEESIAVAVENYNKSTRHPTRSTKRCVRYDEKYLSQVLERSGMLNQWFMANNPEDAGRNFARCYKNLFKTKFDSVDLPQDDSLRFKVDDIDVPFACNDLCQNITWRLNEALRNEKNDTILLNAPFSDDAEISSTLTNCQLGKFIPVGNCIPQGAEEFEEHSKLCTSCHGIYMLGKMCFPRFINAIRCENQIRTSGCIFDKISMKSHGSCYMRTLTLNVLRNEGSEKCQEWYHEYIEVPTSCECQLDAESLLLSAVKP